MMHSDRYGPYMGRAAEEKIRETAELYREHPHEWIVPYAALLFNSNKEEELYALQPELLAYARGVRAPPHQEGMRDYISQAWLLVACFAHMSEREGITEKERHSLLYEAQTLFGSAHIHARLLASQQDLYLHCLLSLTGAYLQHLLGRKDAARSLLDREVPELAARLTDPASKAYIQSEREKLVKDILGPHAS